MLVHGAMTAWGRKRVKSKEFRDRKEDFAASIAKNVLLRGQFPLVRVLSKWTQLRVGAAVLPRAAHGGESD